MVAGLPAGFAIREEPAGVFAAAGEAVAAGGAEAFLSSGEGVDVREGGAEDNALDCAHEVNAMRAMMVPASARRFIIVESLLVGRKITIASLDRTLQGVGVLTRPGLKSENVDSFRSCNSSAPREGRFRVNEANEGCFRDS
jgi:hypothetical protein